MKPYKIKHIPTGLYFQPHKYRGSHLSIRGKIYQTKVNGVFDNYSKSNGYFKIYCEKDSRIFRDTKDKLPWSKAKRSYNKMIAITLLTDWIIEEIL